MSVQVSVGKLFVLVMVLTSLVQSLYYGETHYLTRTVVEGSDVILPCYMNPRWAYYNITMAWLHTQRDERARVVASATRYIKRIGHRPKITVNIDDDRVSFFRKPIHITIGSLYIKRTTQQDGGSYMCKYDNGNFGVLYSTVLSVVPYQCSQPPTGAITMEGCETSNAKYSAVHQVSCSMSSVDLADKPYVFKWMARYQGEVEFHPIPNAMGTSDIFLMATLYELRWWSTVMQIKCVLEPPDDCPGWTRGLHATCDVKYKIPYTTRHVPPSIVSGADVVICMDMSTSMGQTNFQLEKQLVRDILTQLLPPGSPYVVSVCSFSDTILMTRLQPAKTLQTLLSTTSGYRLQRFGTDTAKTLLKTGRELLQRGRDGRQKIAVVITDSYSDDLHATLAAGERLIRADIHTIFVPFGDNIHDLSVAELKRDGHTVIPHKSRLLRETAHKIVGKIRQIGAKQGRDQLPVCDKIHLDHDSRKYKIRNSTDEYTCPLYTSFDPDTCECSNLQSGWQKGVCEGRGHLLYFPFDSDIYDAAHRNNETKINIHGDVYIVSDPPIRGTIGSGALFTNSMSRVSVPVIEGVSFSEIFLRFRYYIEISDTPAIDHFHTLVAFNGIACDFTSFGVMLAEVGTATGIYFDGLVGRHKLTIPRTTHGWTDVEIAITTSSMKVKVGASPTITTDFSPSRHTETIVSDGPLDVGGGCREKEVHPPAYIDDLYLFDCIPYEL